MGFYLNFGSGKVEDDFEIMLTLFSIFWSLWSSAAHGIVKYGICTGYKLRRGWAGTMWFCEMQCDWLILRSVFCKIFLYAGNVFKRWKNLRNILNTSTNSGSREAKSMNRCTQLAREHNIWNIICLRCRGYCCEHGIYQFTPSFSTMSDDCHASSNIPLRQTNSICCNGIRHDGVLQFVGHELQIRQLEIIRKDVINWKFNIFLAYKSIIRCCWSYGMFHFPSFLFFYVEGFQEWAWNVFGSLILLICYEG